MHDEADAPIPGRDQMPHREPDDAALVVGDVVQSRLVREVVDFHRTEVRPVELQRDIQFAHVRGDDQPVDAPGLENAVEPRLREPGLAHPKMLELETEILGLGLRAGEELRMGGDLLPAEARVPVGHVRERRRVAPRHRLAAVGDEGLQVRVGLVAHALGEFLDPIASLRGKARMIAQRQGDGGDMHTGFSGDVG
jgi:hypothetical protein